MRDSDARQRYLEMGLGKLLDVVDVVHQWVLRVLSQSGLQQMQDHLGILRIVLVPGIIRSLQDWEVTYLPSSLFK